jgi:threonine dehydratase
VGLEILEDLPDAGTVLVPVGGGGLLGGIASAIKALRPRTRVVAVELEAGPGLGPALAAGRPVPAPRPAKTLCDGMTPPFVGALAIEIAREAVDDVVTVTEEAVIEAMALLMTRAKLVVEGSGAAATAALLSGRVKALGPYPVVALVSGGNIDLGRIPRQEDTR